MINPIYNLSEKQREFAKEWGQKRNNAKDPKIRDKLKNSHGLDPKRAHILGIAGEIAYAALTNQKVDEKIYEENKGDLMDFDGIELKTATWPHPDMHLKIPESEFFRKTPEAYVLAKIDEDYKTVQFMGSIDRAQFFKIKGIRRHSFTKNYYVSEYQLLKGLAFKEDGILKLTYFYK